jgi:zinc finger RNA-binding protein
MTAAAVQALLAEENVVPVGEDYVETRRDPATKQINFYCKLCDCSVLDNTAKMMHLKGRRHRLAYKVEL